MVQLASWTRCQVRRSLGDLVSACKKVVQILYTGIRSLSIAECSDDSGSRDTRTWGERQAVQTVWTRGGDGGGATGLMDSLSGSPFPR